MSKDRDQQPHAGRRQPTASSLATGSLVTASAETTSAQTRSLPAGLLSTTNSRLRVLALGCLPEPPAWVGLRLQCDAAGYVDVSIRWTDTSAAALTALREKPVDCLLIGSPHAGEIAIERLAALRAGGFEEPAVVLLPAADDALYRAAAPLAAEVLVTAAGWESPALLSAIEQAIRRTELACEHRRLVSADRQRLSREQEEADRLLSQQRQILESIELLAGEAAAAVPHDNASLALESMAADSNSLASHAAPCHCGPDGAVNHAAPARPRDSGTAALESDQSRPEQNWAAGSVPDAFDSDIGDGPWLRLHTPAAVTAYYDDLLRSQVILGSGSHAAEIQQLAELFVAGNVEPRGVLQLHLERVAELVAGLGSRSSRHVLARADALAMELLLQVGELYRQKAIVEPAPAASNDAYRHAA